MRSSNSRDVTQALIICLFKLRTGSSNNLISSIFDIENEIKVSDFCESVINSFQKDVLPKYFGLQSVTREDLVRDHTSIYAKKLFKLKNELALVFDGTYLRQKVKITNTKESHIQLRRNILWSNHSLFAPQMDSLLISLVHF